MSVPCYGEPYCDIFLNLHLPSLLDETNIPAVKDRINYLVVTDKETEPKILNHNNFKKLTEMVGTGIGIIADKSEFNSRYNILISTFKTTVEFALKNDMYVSSTACDMVFGKEYLPKILSYMESHDAVFFVPMRTAYEPMKDLLPEARALSGYQLCNLAIENMHPLWTHSYWDNPLFTKLPYSMLWGNEEGLLVRSFSISPMIFKPKPEHLNTGHVLDIEIPGTMENPMWIENFVDCPVIGCEPINCFYPVFNTKKASIPNIRNWTTHLLPSQIPFLARKFWYPKKQIVMKNPSIDSDSDRLILDILGG